MNRNLLYTVISDGNYKISDGDYIISAGDFIISGDDYKTEAYSQ